VRRRSENGRTRGGGGQGASSSLQQTRRVCQIGGEIVTGLGADHISFPHCPASLTRPRADCWTLDNAGAARHGVEASISPASCRGTLTTSQSFTVARDDSRPISTAGSLWPNVQRPPRSGTPSCSWCPARNPPPETRFARAAQGNWTPSPPRAPPPPVRIDHGAGVLFRLSPYTLARKTTITTRDQGDSQISAPPLNAGA